MTGVFRRPHKKSKKGCMECKKRHIKCDEGRPNCGNCKISVRRCAYQENLAQSHQHLMGSLGSNQGDTSTSMETRDRLSEFSCGISVSLEREEMQVLNIQHLELFRHLINEDLALFGYDKSVFNAFNSELMDTIFRAPYLMHQILAFAALNLSTTTPDRRNILQRHATRLGSSAFQIFDSMNLNLDEESCLPIFLFVSTRAFQGLSEKLLHCPNDFETFLDDFVNILRLHQKVHLVTQQHWDVLLQSALGPLLKRESGYLGQISSGIECSEILSLVCAASIDLPTQEIYQTTIQLLQRSINWSQARVLESPKIGSIISWLVVISPDFITLLSLRKPEALVILSHFGGLLHLNREVWAFGDSGRYIIQSVANYLGHSWDNWLHWPSTVLQDNHAML